MRAGVLSGKVAERLEQCRHDDVVGAVALLAAAQRRDIHGGEQLAQLLERRVAVGVGAEEVAAQPREQQRERLARREARLEGLGEQGLGVDELAQRRDRFERRVAHAHHPRLLEAQHLRARRRQDHAVDRRLGETLAVREHVCALREAHVQHVGAGLVARVPAQVIGLVLPEGVPLQQILR